jgi:hypothetical protein
MARGWIGYTRAFMRNLVAEDMPYSRWIKLVARNRARAMTRGCCGHPGEPGC